MAADECDTDVCVDSDDDEVLINELSGEIAVRALKSLERSVLMPLTLSDPSNRLMMFGSTVYIQYALTHHFRRTER